MAFPVKIIDEQGGEAKGWIYAMPGMPRACDESLDAIERASEASGMDEVRLASLWALVISSAACDEGDIIEVGCGRGGSGLVICKARSYGKINAGVSLYDTFRGLVGADRKVDKHKDGEMDDATPAATYGFIRRHGEECEVIAGVFPGSFQKDRAYRFAHIDVDTHRSTADALDALIPSMATGGIIAVDDYGIESTPGVTKAVNERLDDQRVRWIFTSTNQAVAVVL